MATTRPPFTPRSDFVPTADMQADVDRHSFLDFAGVLLLLVGIFNIIDGISAISGSKYVDKHVLFANLTAWGWFFLIVGIATAGINLISQLSASHTFVFWALTIVALDVLVIYGLVRYGGDRGRAR